MFGKHFASMYDGSMVGSGALVFAVMGYVVANQEPDIEVGSQVELNPILLAAILGEPVTEVEKAIEWLCAPDPRSRSQDKEGRRLVRIGAFAYQVVNGAKYRAIRDAEHRREYQRIWAAEKRAKEDRKKKILKRGRELPGAATNEALEKNGATEAELGRHSDSMLPDRPERPPEEGEEFSNDGECFP